LAHAFLWGYSYKRLELAQLLGRHGVFLTWKSETTAKARAGVIVLPSAEYVTKVRTDVMTGIVTFTGLRIITRARYRSSLRFVFSIGFYV
jgi:hypothetical protein